MRIAIRERGLSAFGVHAHSGHSGLHNGHYERAGADTIHYGPGRFFKLPAQGNAAPTRVLIAQAGEMEVALPVDEIEGVRPLPLEDIQNVLPTLTGGAAAYLQGVSGVADPA